MADYLFSCFLFWHFGSCQRNSWLCRTKLCKYYRENSSVVYSYFSDFSILWFLSSILLLLSKEKFLVFRSCKKQFVFFIYKNAYNPPLSYKAGGFTIFNQRFTILRIRETPPQYPFNIVFHKKAPCFLSQNRAL